MIALNFILIKAKAVETVLWFTAHHALLFYHSISYLLHRYFVCTT